jgi:hypothetical protein
MVWWQQLARLRFKVALLQAWGSIVVCSKLGVFAYLEDVRL